MRLTLVTGAEAFVTGAVGARHWCGWRSSLVRLVLVTGVVGARTGTIGVRHWCGWRSSLVRLALVTAAVGARHWCGSRHFPVKISCLISSFRRDVKEIRAIFLCVTPQNSADIRIQEIYMQTRLTASGVLKDFLEKVVSGSSYIIRSFSLYTQQDQDGTGSILILLASCQQTCMTYTIAVCTAKNS